MNNKLSFLIVIMVVITLSGCFDNRDSTRIVQYSDDIITVEDWVVQNEEPREGSLMTISFLVKNNGDLEEGVDVEVDFFDIGDFKVVDLSCQEVLDGDQTVFNH